MDSGSTGKQDRCKNCSQARLLEQRKCALGSEHMRVVKRTGKAYCLGRRDRQFAGHKHQTCVTVSRRVRANQVRLRATHIRQCCRPRSAPVRASAAFGLSCLGQEPFPSVFAAESSHDEIPGREELRTSRCPASGILTLMEVVFCTWAADKVPPAAFALLANLAAASISSRSCLRK